MDWLRSAGQSADADRGDPQRMSALVRARALAQLTASRQAFLPATVSFDCCLKHELHVDSKSARELHTSLFGRINFENPSKLYGGGLLFVSI
jgi:hypothetical protein